MNWSIVAIIGVIAVAAIGGLYLYKKSGGFGPPFVPVSPNPRTAGGSTFNTLCKTVTTAAAGSQGVPLPSGVSNAYCNTVEKGAKGVVEGFKTAGKAVGNVAEDVWDAVKFW